MMQYVLGRLLTRLSLVLLWGNDKKSHKLYVPYAGAAAAAAVLQQCLNYPMLDIIISYRKLIFFRSFSRGKMFIYPAEILLN